jgi:hypothetical protein
MKIKNGYEIKGEQKLRDSKRVLETCEVCRRFERSHVEIERVEVITDCQKPGERISEDLAGPYMLNSYPRTVVVAVDC